jgi:hypothetical protein
MLSHGDLATYLCSESGVQDVHSKKLADLDDLRCDQDIHILGGASTAPDLRRADDGQYFAVEGGPPSPATWPSTEPACSALSAVPLSLTTFWLTLAISPAHLAHPSAPSRCAARRRRHRSESASRRSRRARSGRAPPPARVLVASRCGIASQRTRQLWARSTSWSWVSVPLSISTTT